MGRMRAVAAMAAAWAIVGMACEAVAVEVRIPKELPPPESQRPREPKAELKDLGGGMVAVDISELFNNDGITSEADRNDADFDEWKQSFAAEELPEAGKLQPKGVKAVFLFPTKEPKKYNNIACQGQLIPLGLKARQLHLLVTATDGNHQAQVGLEYADGNAQADLKVTDWCAKAAFGETAAVVCPSRIAIGIGGEQVRGKEAKETHIWAVAVPLDAKRELKAIRLPANPKIHVFAITLAK